MTESGGDDERRRIAHKHMFVVNRVPEISVLMRQLLRDDGFNATTTKYVPETLDTTPTLAPDLVIADLVAGQQAGRKVLLRLHADVATRGISLILVVTNLVLPERARQDAERLGSRNSIV